MVGEVTKTEGEWIEKFLLMNLKESLNAPHDLSHCLNQVLQASPLKEIFDLNNNRNSTITLIESKEITKFAYKQFHIGTSPL